MVNISIHLRPEKKYMINLIGTYEGNIDDKGRVMLPVDFINQLKTAKELKNGFVIKTSVFHDCLELYPMTEYSNTIKEINILNRFVAKNNDFIRAFTAGIKQITLDGTARLLIPKDLLKSAGIKKPVVFSSHVNVIEIWDRSKYYQTIAKSKKNFAKLAEEVMGKLGNKQIQ